MSFHNISESHVMYKSRNGTCEGPRTAQELAQAMPNDKRNVDTSVFTSLIILCNLSAHTMHDTNNDCYTYAQLVLVSEHKLWCLAHLL